MKVTLITGAASGLGNEFAKLYAKDNNNLLLVDDDGNELVIDSRPSDAIAIALRTDSPIYVTENVICDATISTNKPKEEKDAQDFHDFIQSLKPSDFQKFIDENPESDQ